MSANTANSATHPLRVDKWVVSWTQAFAMCICVLALHGECLQVKADMVLFASSTVWSISEHVRGIRKDKLYKSTLSLPLSYLNFSIQSITAETYWHILSRNRSRFPEIQFYQMVYTTVCGWLAILHQSVNKADIIYEVITFSCMSLHGVRPCDGSVVASKIQQRCSIACQFKPCA